MKKELIEYKEENGDIEFFFNGYDYWEDFDLIYDFVKDKIHPESDGRRGITDMDGYVVKDGIRMELRFDEMTGNEMLYKSTGKAEDAEKAKGWARLIWEELEKRAMPRE